MTAVTGECKPNAGFLNIESSSSKKTQANNPHGGDIKFKHFEGFRKHCTVFSRIAETQPSSDSHIFHTIQLVLKINSNRVEFLPSYGLHLHMEGKRLLALCIIKALRKVKSAPLSLVPSTLPEMLNSTVSIREGRTFMGVVRAHSVTAPILEASPLTRIL
ncbi:hypothetical protein J6590_046351 [Homalodisca vitripennis]|nr:hypothetical protein J6590_046351 [Homalodisca vitripennis]